MKWLKKQPSEMVHYTRFAQEFDYKRALGEKRYEEISEIVWRQSQESTKQRSERLNSSERAM